MAPNEKVFSGQQTTRDLILSAGHGDRVALAKLLSRLEKSGPSVVGQFNELLLPAQSAFRVGITGPPGAGKSTLIAQMIGGLRKRGKTVAVLAVDPSSPFTQGAILGDRIRYSEHVLDDGVFIRSLGSRGSLGGLSASAWLMVRAFDHAGFDVVLLETVGVGQTELEIMNVADHVSVVLTPESGDGIQGMKAGLMEISDLFLVNKSDRPGADVFAREIEAALELDPRAMSSNPPKVLKLSALTGAGVDAVLSELLLQLKSPGIWHDRRSNPKRLQAEAKAMLMIEAERRATLHASQIQTPEMLGKLFREISQPS
jgi:LAO/AO transport system kinase